MRNRITVLIIFLLPLAALSPAAPSLPAAEKKIGIFIEQPGKMKQEEEAKSVKPAPLNTLSLQSMPHKAVISVNSNLCLSTKDGKLLIYDLKNNLSFSRKNLSKTAIYALNAHPQENKVVFGDRDGMIGVVNPADDKIIKTIYELKFPISDIAYSADGKTVAVSHFGGTITLYDIETKELVLEAKPHKESIYSLSIDKTASLLATASRDKSVRILSLKKGKVVLILNGHKSLALRCIFSEDNNFLASGGADGRVIVYERKGKSFLRRPYFLWTCGDWVTSLKFFGRYLLAASKDGKIRIFDYKDEALLKVIDTEKPLIDIAVNKNYLCAVHPKELRVYDVKEILGRISGE